MQKLLSILAVCAALSLAPATPAGTAPTNAPLCLTLDLTDGSRITGTPAFSSLPIQTPYAKMDIPIENAASIRIEADHETVSIDLRNGDKLKGVLKLGPLKLETAVGTISVNLAHIRTLWIGSAGGKALPDAFQRGLVLYYPCERDDGNKVTDKSGKGNDGAISGAKWVPNGKSGGAYEFNGVDNVIGVAALNGIPGRARAFTAAVWMKCDQRNNTSPRLLHLGLPDAGQGMWIGPQNRDQLNIGITHGAESISQTPVFDGQFHHIVGVYDNGRISLFIDGKIENSTRAWINLPDKIPFALGQHVNMSVAHTFYNGLLDEVMLFDRALSEEEIKQLYELQK